MSQFGKMMGGMGGMPGMGKDGMPDMATLQKMVAQEKAKQQGGGHGGYVPETCRPCPPSYNKGSCNMGSCSTKIEEADSDDDDMPELEPCRSNATVTVQSGLAQLSLSPPNLLSFLALTIS